MKRILSLFVTLIVALTFSTTALAYANVCILDFSNSQDGRDLVVASTLNGELRICEYTGYGMSGWGAYYEAGDGILDCYDANGNLTDVDQRNLLIETGWSDDKVQVFCGTNTLTGILCGENDKFPYEFVYALNKRVGFEMDIMVTMGDGDDYFNARFDLDQQGLYQRRCGNAADTYDMEFYVEGGDGDDEILLGEGDDLALGGDGIDIIWGYQGMDFLWGGAEDDTIHGGDDTVALYLDLTDYIFGEEGEDTLTGCSGADYIEGGYGDDEIHGGVGDDILYGDDGIFGNYDSNQGDDEIYGDGGNDTIYGEAGDDLLHGGMNDDELYGQDGADTLYGDDGDDILYGDAGVTNAGYPSGDILCGADGIDELHADGTYFDIMCDSSYDTDEFYFGNSICWWSGAYGSDDLSPDPSPCITASSSFCSTYCPFGW